MECLEHEDALPRSRPNRASQRRGGDNGTIPTNGSLAEFDDMSSGVGTTRVSARLFDSSLFSFEEPWTSSIPRDPCMSRESTSASISHICHSSRSHTSSNSSRSHPACLPFFLNNPTILSPDRLDLFSCYYEDEDTRTEESDRLPFCELDKDAGTHTILLYPYSKRACNTSSSWPSANGTFFLPASSASSIASDCQELSNLEDSSDHSSPSWPAQSTMPSKTLAESLDQSDVFVNNTYTAGHVAANVSNSSNHWRPKSARSARSAGRSPSPLLFGRLAGRGKLQKAGATTSLSTETSAPTDTNTDSMVTDDQGSIENNKRRPQSGASPAPTLTREEFEALPVAIQRKYFSTLERLRFAQSSGMVEGIYHHYDDISHQNVKRRRPRQDRSSSEYLAGRIRRRSLRGPRSPVADAQWHSTLSDKSRKRQFTREEQVLLAKNLRASVILDAADEAIYKIGRRACKTSTTDLHLQAPALSTQPSMESMRSGKQHAEKSNRESSVPDSFYDSFRWLDEEDDLDLRLFLDDYHANLRQDLPEPTQEMRPSFRRHLSISKIPFGRASISSSRPATKDASAPSSPAVNSASPVAGVHGRRRSRALSLISPKHAPSASLSSIDPYAAHYQDPEARLKLRVYLASPQKFDEAIEFGFPSTEAISPASQVKDGMRSPGNYRSRHKSVGSEHMRTFLADEDEDDRVDDDEASAPDPESPKTPQPADKPTIRPVPQPIDTVFMHKPSESYAQAPANSREMTLRMTLTRPDLRADEDQIYGWQQQLQARRRSQTSPFQEDGPQPPASYIGEERSKESIERMLAGIDHWGPEPSDRGVMKRFWNRVRRS